MCFVCVCVCLRYLQMVSSSTRTPPFAVCGTSWTGPWSSPLRPLSSSTPSSAGERRDRPLLSLTCPSISVSSSVCEPCARCGPSASCRRCVGSSTMSSSAGSSCYSDSSSSCFPSSCSLVLESRFIYLIIYSVHRNLRSMYVTKNFYLHT